MARAVLYCSLREPGIGVALILVLFTVCGMFRLFRYNISEAKGFEGMPITVNGFLFPLFYLLYMYWPQTLVVWPALFATLSVLMVSSLRFNRIS